MNTDYPSTWPSWVMESIEQLAAAEKPASYLIPDDAPEWVHFLEKELVKVMFPSVKESACTDSGPRLLGKLVKDHDALLNDEHGIEMMVGNALQSLEMLHDRWRKKLSKKAYKRLMDKAKKYEPDVEHFFEVLECLIQKKRECVKAVIQSASEQPYDERRAFFDGYSTEGAVVVDEHGKLAHDRLTTSVYFLMLVFWRYVREFPSTAVLHEWLTKLLGPGVTGDLSRIRKICTRINLKLRPRGRPRKIRH